MKWKEERALVSASGHDRSSRAHATPTLAVGEGKASPSRRAFSGWLKVPGPDPITSIHCRGLAAESMVGMRGSWVPCSQLHCGSHDSVSLHVSCGGRWRPLGVTPRAPPPQPGSSWCAKLFAVTHFCALSFCLVLCIPVLTGVVSMDHQ